MQDLDAYSPMVLSNNEHSLQVDDILSITIGALVPEAAFPCNKNTVCKPILTRLVVSLVVSIAI